MTPEHLTALRQAAAEAKACGPLGALRTAVYGVEQLADEVEQLAAERDEARAELERLKEPPQVELPDDRDGVVKAWFRTYLQWRFQAGRADKAEAALTDACEQVAEADNRHAGAAIRAHQAIAERDEARAALQRVQDLIESYPPGSNFAQSGAQDIFRRMAALDGSAG